MLDLLPDEVFAMIAARLGPSSHSAQCLFLSCGRCASVRASRETFAEWLLRSFGKQEALLRLSQARWPKEWPEEDALKAVGWLMDRVRSS